MPGIDSAVVAASSAISRRKWVKPCCTVPGNAVQAVRAGAAVTASDSVHGIARHGVDGSSIMPPRRPRSGRRRSSTAPSSRVSQNATPQRSGRSGFSAWVGRLSAMPIAAAAMGIAESLPTQAEKPERPLRCGVAFWLTREDGAVLLRRRPERGLLGGMIELPSTPWRAMPWTESEAIAAAPARTAWTALPGTVQHGFTHFRLEMALIAGRTAAPPEGIWARPEEFKNYAFPTLTKKLVNYALSV